MWTILLQGRYPRIEQWCTFIVLKKKPVTKDLWSQFLHFADTIHPDLRNFDPDAAWPCLIDEFVDSIKVV